MVGAVIRAYVLIQTRVGTGAQVAQEVGALQGVLSSDGVTGPYDVIASVEAADLDGIGRLVSSDLHSIDGVTRTLTCIGRTG